MEPTNEIKQMTALWDLVTKPQERNYPSELEEKDREEHLESKEHDCHASPEDGCQECDHW